MSLAQTIDRGFQPALLVQQVKKIVPAFRNHPFRRPTSSSIDRSERFRNDPPTEKDRSDQASCVRCAQRDRASPSGALARGCARNMVFRRELRRDNDASCLQAPSLWLEGDKVLASRASSGL
jgi:hypothetical protein